LEVAMVAKERTLVRQLRNMKKLVKVLEALEPKQCAMPTWMRLEGPLPEPEERGKPGCGTTACLAGWGAILFTPSLDQLPGVGRHTTEIAALWVPERWYHKHLRRQNPQVLRRSHADGVWSTKGEAYVSVLAKELGKWALGPDAEQLFIPGEGRAVGYKVPDGGRGWRAYDQKWMIRRLKATIKRVEAARQQ
jgi:hypothetical protein